MTSENQDLNTVSNQELAPSSIPAQKTLPQEDVNDLVRMAKEKAYHKGRMEALAQINQQATVPASTTVNGGSSNQGATAGMDPDTIRTLVAQEMLKQQQQMQEENVKRQNEEFARKTLMEIEAKTTSAAKEIPDYNQVVGKYDFVKEMPHVLYYANQFPNGGHLLYELSKSPSKMAAIAAAPPSVAVEALRELSTSLDANKAAATTVLPPDPMSQVKPSPLGTDNGSLSVRDFKKIYKG